MVQRPPYIYFFSFPVTFSASGRKQKTYLKGNDTEAPTTKCNIRYFVIDVRWPVSHTGKIGRMVSEAIVACGW